MESSAAVELVGGATFGALAARHLKHPGAPLASLLFGGDEERLGDPAMAMVGGDDERGDTDETAAFGE